nr:MAG TPA: hypothetical protein [Caudoviricetes sp.]
MRLYKLLKDLPTFKAGQLAYISKTGNLIAGTPENQETTETGLIIMIYHETTLKKFPNILTEWFEEIKEPVNSIHWKPNFGEEYWYVNYIGNVVCRSWEDASVDFWLLESGNIYRTKEECEKAHERKLAEVRLRRTSNFEPDWSNNGQNKWTAYYNHNDKELLIEATAFLQYPSAIYFDTYDSIKKSIEENREDWLKYLGIKEW